MSASLASMSATASLLPPSSTAAERAIEGAQARLGELPVRLRDLWNPETCPAGFLPWLAWGLSIDLWNPDWTEAQKRDAIATTIDRQRRKGTMASLRSVLDRFDPMISAVEWFNSDPPMDPHRLRLELPLAAESGVQYDEALVAALLRDIGAVKRLSTHLEAVHKLVLWTDAWLVSGARLMGFDRLDMAADRTSAGEPEWADYLQTEDGEPLLDEAGLYLEDV